MPPRRVVHDPPPFATTTWNRLIEEGPGPCWLTCGLWLLAICPVDCDGLRDRCEGVWGDGSPV